MMPSLPLHDPVNALVENYGFAVLRDKIKNP